MYLRARRRLFTQFKVNGKYFMVESNAFTYVFCIAKIVYVSRRDISSDNLFTQQKYVSQKAGFILVFGQSADLW